METISNVVNTASKAIWGEPNTAANETGGKEPASGVQGKGTATEPYDGGNAPTPLETVEKTYPFATTTSTIAPSTDTTTSTTHTDKTPTDVTSGASVDESSKPTTNHASAVIDSEPKPLETTTGVSSATTVDETSKPTVNPTSAIVGGEPKPLETTKDTGVTGSSAQKFAPKGSDIIPSESSNNTGVPPTSGAAPSQKQQGADRPTEAPKEDGQAALSKRDPNDHSGEPLHIHNSPDKEIPTTQEEHGESKVGLPGGQEHGKEPKGTGEQWEKTTGLAADGGDFDATKPGAGKEADRLLEEKGVHRDAKGNMDKKPETSADTAEGGKEKVSKMEKLKEKLHIGHGHKDK